MFDVSKRMEGERLRGIQVVGMIRISKAEKEAADKEPSYIAGVAIEVFEAGGQRILERVQLTRLAEGETIDISRLREDVKQSLEAYIRRFA